MTWREESDREEALVMRQLINLLWEKSSNLEAIQHTYDEDNLITTQRLKCLEDKVELLLSEVGDIKDNLKGIQQRQSTFQQKESFTIPRLAGSKLSMLKTRHSLPTQFLQQSEIDVTFDAASPTSPGLSASLQDVLGELKFLDENEISSTCSVETKDEMLRNLSYDTSMYNDSTQISSSESDSPPEMIRIDQSEHVDMTGLEPPELLREFDPPASFRDDAVTNHHSTEHRLHDARQPSGDNRVSDVGEMDNRSNTLVKHEIEAIDQDIFELNLTSDNLVNILSSTPKDPQVFHIPSPQSQKMRSFVVENVVCKLPVVMRNRPKVMKSVDNPSFRVNEIPDQQLFSTPQVINIDKENKSYPSCERDVENNVRVKCQITIEAEEDKCETFRPVTQPIKSAFERHDWTRSDTFDVIPDKIYRGQEEGREKDSGPGKTKPPSKPRRSPHKRPRLERGENDDVRHRRDEERQKKEEERSKKEEEGQISSFCRTDSTEPMSEHSTFSVCSSAYSSTGLDYEVQYIQPQVSEEEEEEDEEDEEEEEEEERPVTVLGMHTEDESMCHEPEPVHLLHHEDDVIRPTGLGTIPNTLCTSRDLRNLKIDDADTFNEDPSSEYTTPINSRPMSGEFGKEAGSDSVFTEDVSTPQNADDVTVLNAGRDHGEGVSPGSVDEVFEMKTKATRGSSKSVNDYFRGLVGDRIRSKSERSECETSGYNNSSSEDEESHEGTVQEERLLAFSNRRKSEC